MEIANPIYDAAFKYLMRDDRSARLLVGRIAGLEVESLEVRAQEAARPRDRPAGRGRRGRTVAAGPVPPGLRGAGAAAGRGPAAGAHRDPKDQRADRGGALPGVSGRADV